MGKFLSLAVFPRISGTNSLVKMHGKDMVLPGTASENVYNRLIANSMVEA